MRRTLHVMVLVGAVVLAGCSSGGGTGVPEMVAENRAFSPSELTWTAGEEVNQSIVNNDDGAHNFTVEELDIVQELPAGAAALIRYTPEESGTYEFFCSLHPQDMRGTLTVE